MIQLHDLRYSIGPRILFDHLDWVLSPGDRCALVGPNGAGKTTLIRIMLGELPYDSGSRVLARGTRLGYLPQEAAERYDGTVLERAMEAHRGVLEMREELDELHRRLERVSADDPELEAVLERAGDLQHHLDLHDEHALPSRARSVLTGLGFSTRDQDRPLAEFSGGWRMRAALAALLLTDPTLLFLDEPTNHLDLPAMEWLEDYLQDFHGALVVVSHDRVFLDRVATHVKELDRAVLSDYPMKFTRYLEEKELRREQLEAHNEQLQQKIAQLQRFVDRFGAKNTKASQAQSKRKQIARLKAEHVIIPRRAAHIHFHFPDPPHAGRTLVRLKDSSFAYPGGADVFTRANVEIDRRDKIAIVGANGAGKTTLLRVLAGQLAPQGDRESYPHTRLGYFAQHAAETLEGDLTVLGALEEVAPPAWRPRLRSLLGNFLFSGDDVFKLCRVLSGGERQRVALSRMLLEPTNVLLLDEPTHHLDLAGKEVLEDALDQYPGAVVVVTHDRSLMARIASRVLEVHSGRVTLYPGGYDDYESARLARDQAAADRAAGRAPRAGPDGAAAPASRVDPRGVAAPAGATGPAAPKKSGRPGAGVPSRSSTAPAPPLAARSDARKREKEVARIERDIEQREQRMRALETELADPAVYHDGPKAKALVSDYEKLRAELESLWQRMEDIAG
ncbi:MAG TPA: ABC-F family ATP-binding cassette domain-containing protein [Candidatus Udaeobacter sp.]|nr:ABC-F family ATP-binding cassette domain-containing protein [Candidatus Udaeobacter sp.]